MTEGSGSARLRGLLALVIVMGVLIVAGIGVVGLTIVRRLGGPAPGGLATLDEPAGTRMVAVAGVGDRLGVLLQGGGADRLVLIDGHSGQVVGRVALRAGGP